MDSRTSSLSIAFSAYSTLCHIASQGKHFDAGRRSAPLRLEHGRRTMRGKPQVQRRRRVGSIGFVRPRLVLLMGILLVDFFLSGCRRLPEPVTITFLDPEGLPDLGRRHLPTDAALEEFTRETGIRVNHLPAPEDNREHFLL